LVWVLSPAILAATSSRVVTWSPRSGSSDYQVVPVSNGGAVGGTIRVDNPGDVDPLPVSKDHATCGKEIADPSASVFSDGNLQWAFVYLEGVTAGKPLPTTAIQINNQGCLYVPYVQGGTVGAKIEVVNSDDILHNVHSYVGRRTLWNLGLPIRGMKVPKRLPSRPGLLQFKCDLHEWMRGWIHVMEHPYFAVTDAAGAFRIDDVPAGSYTLVVWHERWGEERRAIEVDAEGETTEDIVLPR
jgi:plastocyanin